MPLSAALCVFPMESKLPSSRTDIAVFLFVIGHVLPAADLLFELSGFSGFVIDGFDEAHLSVLFQIQVVVQTFVTRIRYNIPVFFLVLLFQPAQKRV